MSHQDVRYTTTPRCATHNNNKTYRVGTRVATYLADGRDEVHGPEETEDEEPSTVLHLFVEFINLRDASFPDCHGTQRAARQVRWTTRDGDTAGTRHGPSVLSTSSFSTTIPRSPLGGGGGKFGSILTLEGVRGGAVTHALSLRMPRSSAVDLVPPQHRDRAMKRIARCPNPRPPLTGIAPAAINPTKRQVASRA